LNASGVIQKRGYMMAQFSRFVRPGHYRMGETNSGSSSVSAFKNVTNNQFTIVAVNSYSLAFDQTFVLTNFPPSVTLTPWITSATQSLVTLSAITITNGTFLYNLPANSIITFVGVVNSNNAPVFTVVAPQTVNPGVTVLVTNAVSDSGLPGQTLTFSLLTAPTNTTLTTLNASNAIFTWRPLISQAASTNTIQIKVTDNGVPNLSATNNFVITVNPAVPPAFNSMALGGQISLVVTGIIGPDYSLLTSTNLVNWQSLTSTNPTVLPFTFTDTNTSDMQRFYRIQLGP
jgi:glucuronoarabinoxylan endo-1,4-beta-xylanase